MSDAYLCDGCGEFFEGAPAGGLQDYNEDSYPETTHELCEDCHGSVVTALNNESLDRFADITEVGR